MYKKLQSSLGWGFKEIRWEQKVINVEYKKNFFSSIQEKKQKRLKKILWEEEVICAELRAKGQHQGNWENANSLEG